MPDKRVHRGPHPEDERLFSAEQVKFLRLAVEDYSLLLTKGYAQKSALKLVGDKFALVRRQRLALMRSSCSDQRLTLRRQNEVAISELAGQSIAIDGYNILITIEAALSGGLVFIGRDRCCRDLASMHGTYRKVTETTGALELIGLSLVALGFSQAFWLLDSPVSNSGRLKALISELAQKRNWPWDVRLMYNPDAELARTDFTVASSDSVVLDRAGRWTNLAAHIIRTKIPTARMVDLSDAQ